MTEEAKATNPKDRIGMTKLPLELLPPTAMAVWCLAHLDGALKYGTWNWRIAGVRASIYAAAAMRHIECWFHGENKDPDSGVHNLGHAMACLAIIIDAEVVGKLIDDRAPSIDLRQFFNDLNVTVMELRKLREGHTPRHYSIADDIATTEPDPVQLGGQPIPLAGLADACYDVNPSCAYVGEGGPLLPHAAASFKAAEAVSVGRVYHDRFENPKD